MPYWPGNWPKPKASLPYASRAGIADHLAVVVQVQAAGNTCVDLGRVPEGVDDRLGAVLADGQVIVLEEGGASGFGVEIKLVDQQDVRPGALDDLGDVPGLDILGSGKVAEQFAGLVAIERGIKSREPDDSAFKGSPMGHVWRDDAQHQHSRKTKRRHSWMRPSARNRLRGRCSADSRRIPGSPGLRHTPDSMHCPCPETICHAQFH